MTEVKRLVEVAKYDLPFEYTYVQQNTSEKYDMIKKTASDSVHKAIAKQSSPKTLQFTKTPQLAQAYSPTKDNKSGSISKQNTENSGSLQRKQIGSFDHKMSRWSHRKQNKLEISRDSEIEKLEIKTHNADVQKSSP